MRDQHGPIGGLFNGFRRLFGPLPKGDHYTTDGNTIYIARKLPGPGTQNRAFIDLNLPQYSPIDAGYINNRELIFSGPTLTQPQTLGVVSIGGYENSLNFTPQQLIQMQDQLSATAQQLNALASQGGQNV